MLDFNKAKYISNKQFYNYGWQNRDGTIYDKVTGKRIYTTYITYIRERLLGSFKPIQNRIDGFIYFYIGNKFYKVDAIIRK